MLMSASGPRPSTVIFRVEHKRSRLGPWSHSWYKRDKIDPMLVQKFEDTCFFLGRSLPTKEQDRELTAYSYKFPHARRFPDSWLNGFNHGFQSVAHVYQFIGKKTLKFFGKVGFVVSIYSAEYAYIGEAQVYYDRAFARRLQTLSIKAFLKKYPQ